MANNVIKEMGVTKGVKGMEAKAYVINFDKFRNVSKDLSEPGAPLDTKDKVKSKPGDQDIKPLEKATDSLTEAVLPEDIPFDPKAAEAALADIIKSKGESELQDIIKAIAGGKEEDYDQIQNLIIAIKQDQKALPEVTATEESSSTHYANGVAKLIGEGAKPDKNGKYPFQKGYIKPTGKSEDKGKKEKPEPKNESLQNGVKKLILEGNTPEQSLQEVERQTRAQVKDPKQFTDLINGLATDEAIKKSLNGDQDALDDFTVTPEMLNALVTELNSKLKFPIKLQ